MDENTKDCEEINGYSNSGARLKAYRLIYLKHPDKYQLPFIDYDVFFADGDKNNLRSWNLDLVPSEPQTSNK